MNTTRDQFLFVCVFTVEKTCVYDFNISLTKQNNNTQTNHKTFRGNNIPWLFTWVIKNDDTVTRKKYVMHPPNHLRNYTYPFKWSRSIESNVVRKLLEKNTLNWVTRQDKQRKPKCIVVYACEWITENTFFPILVYIIVYLERSDGVHLLLPSFFEIGVNHMRQSIVWFRWTIQYSKWKEPITYESK